MGLQIGQSKIEQDRYVEIKKMAYYYYKVYNSLDRVSRKKILQALPELNTPFETAVLRNTLLFPDTKELLSTPKEALYKVLRNFASINDGITREDMMTKYLEYGMQGTSKLFQNGLLEVMDDLNYPDNSISEKEYLSTKKEAFELLDEFTNIPLNKKVRFIEQCLDENSYQIQIQISTLLIPNDKLLVAQLNKYSVSELADYYQVPTSVIQFKKEEYVKQETIELINQNKLPQAQPKYLWCKAELDDGIIDKIWDQSFYRGIEQEYIDKANSVLEKMFKCRTNPTK